MVIGPTPPGTGVIAAGDFGGARIVDVADQPVLAAVFAAMRLIPTSITVAPGFSQSPRTISGRPTAATTMSARRTTSARSRVRLWARVTVQFSASSSCAIGLPTMLERPITTASRPDRSPSRSLRSIRQPSGVQGTSPSSPTASRPALIGMEAVDVLGGIDRLDHRLVVDPGRERQLDEYPVHRLVGVELVDQREQLLLRDGVGKAMLEARHPRVLRSPAPWSGHRPGSPDPRRPGRRPGRAPGRRPRRRPGRPRRRAREAAAANARPSMRSALTGSSSRRRGRLREAAGRGSGGR